MATEAFLLITYAYKSSSAVATFITENGLVKAICRSVKKNSKNIGSDLNTTAKLSLTLAGAGELLVLKESSVIKDYKILHKNAETSVIISYIRETLLYISLGGDYEKKYFLLMEKSLEAMEEYVSRNMNKSLKPFIRAFEIKALSAAGIVPALEKCVLCGKKQSDAWYCSFDESGIICGECINERRGIYLQKLSNTTLYIMQNLKHKTLMDIIKSDLDCNNETDENIKKINRTMLYNYIGHTLKSARIIDSMIE